MLRPIHIYLSLAIILLSNDRFEEEGFAFQVVLQPDDPNSAALVPPLELIRRASRRSLAYELDQSHRLP